MEVLVIARDDDRATILAACVREEGRTIVRAPAAAIDAAMLERATLVLADVSGDRALIEHLRARYFGPLVVVCADGTDDDELAALDAGADDFLRTPLVPRILRARVARLAQPRALCSIGPMVLDRQRRQVTAHGAPVALTSIELDVLWVLAVRAGQVVSREQLYREVRHTAYDGRDRGLDIHVSRIRPKIERFGVAITAVRGTGYVLST